jgi:hypothetical protein
MTDERERDARNNALLARLGSPPTKAQILAELDLEIIDAIDLALAANLRGVAHLLRMAKLEVEQVQRRSELNERPKGDLALSERPGAQPDFPLGCKCAFSFRVRRVALETIDSRESDRGRQSPTNLSGKLSPRDGATAAAWTNPRSQRHREHR